MGRKLGRCGESMKEMRNGIANESRLMASESRGDATRRDDRPGQARRVDGQALGPVDELRVELAVTRGELDDFATFDDLVWRRLVLVIDVEGDGLLLDFGSLVWRVRDVDVGKDVLDAWLLRLHNGTGVNAFRFVRLVRRQAAIALGTVVCRWRNVSRIRGLDQCGGSLIADSQRL